MKKQVKLIALKMFRIKVGDALVWIKTGQEYSVDHDKAKFHVDTGRGKLQTGKAE